VFYILKIIEFVINLLPQVITLKIGVFIGQIFFLIDRKHRRLAISNISRVFGNKKNKKEIELIAKKSFHNIGKNLIEFFRKTPKGIKVTGFSNLQKAIKKDKKVIIILGHFGNWELLGRLAAKNDIKVVTVGREMKSRGVDRYIRQTRIDKGLKILDKKGSANKLLKALKEDKSVAILIDQYAGRKRGVFVDFFGIPTSTTPSPAVLTLRTNVSVIPIFIVRRKRDRHEVIIEEPVEIKRSENMDKNIFDNTQKFVKFLEKYISKYPEQWWWVHRRWR